ncbi:MAG: tetratricopeptide repeat protein, partial [Phycisphaerae bacterium]|nr:tetratricopeptide repeat protein [Phycisphaerae bacterium]
GDPPARPGFLDQDGPRIPENPLLRSWTGLKYIWSAPHRLPDFSPITYTTYLLEARLWGTERPLSATGFRSVNLLIHIAAAIALWHLLARLELPGAWLAAAIFAVHPANVSAVTWPGQRPWLLGTWMGLMTLIVFFRLTGLNPPPEKVHRWFRLPQGRAQLGALTILLTVLTVGSSPAVAAMLGPVALLLSWWERGRFRRGDVQAAAPLLGLTLLVTAGALMLAIRQGAGEFSLPQCPWWYRPIAIVQQYAFYAWLTLVPMGISFAYAPFPRFGWGALLSVGAVAAATGGAVWARRHWGRGPLAVMAVFAVSLAPAVIYVESREIYGGWVGAQRLYPGSAAIITGVVACLAGARWALIRREAALAVGAIALATVASAGVVEASRRTSQQRLWEHVLQRDPRNVVALVRLADSAIRRREFTTASGYLQRAVEIRPNDPDPLVKLGELEEARRQPERAIVHYLKALKLDPDHFDANFGLAHALATQKESQQALEQYQKLLTMRPEDPILHNNIGLLHADRGEFEQAEQSYRRALRIDPRATAARINLATLLYRRGEIESAVRELTVVLEIDRDNFDAFMNAGAMLGQMNQFEKAAVLFRRAIELDDQMAAAHANLANALLGQELFGKDLTRGQRISLLSEAAHHFEKAAELDPARPSYRDSAQQARRRASALQSGS